MLLVIDPNLENMRDQSIAGSWIPTSYDSVRHCKVIPDVGGTCESAVII